MKVDVLAHHWGRTDIVFPLWQSTVTSSKLLPTRVLDWLQLVPTTAFMPHKLARSLKERHVVRWVHRHIMQLRVKLSCCYLFWDKGESMRVSASAQLLEELHCDQFRNKETTLLPKSKITSISENKYNILYAGYDLSVNMKHQIDIFVLKRPPTLQRLHML